MRILHVLDHSIPFLSGYALRTKAILTQQRALGWQTFQVTSAKHPGASALVEEVDGFRFYRTPPLPAGLAALPAIKQYAVITSLAKRLEEVVDEVEPDILHAHSPALNGFAALKVAHSHRLPLVYECRAFWEDAATDHGTSREGGLRYHLTRALENHVFKHADAITTICEGLRRDIISRGIAAEKISVIPNAVDPQRFRTDRKIDPALRSELGLQGGTVLGFLGSYYAYEGLALLLEAYPLIAARRSDVRLLLVGGGPQELALKAQARRLGIADRVIFSGKVSHDSVHRYYDLIDVLVYPRLSMRLTDLVTPLKPLEAMAQGRLVVASDVGGHREMIRDCVNGRLFRSGDKQDLADTVLDLLDSPETWDALQTAGRFYVESERCWASSIARYAEVYRAALQHSQATEASKKTG